MADDRLPGQGITVSSNLDWKNETHDREQVGPVGYPTHVAGAEQLAWDRSDWVGAYDEVARTDVVLPLCGPIFPTRPYDATLAPDTLYGDRRVRTLPGERAADVAAIDKAASAWLRARCDEDLSVVDVRREVTAPNGVESMWQYPLVKADRVAYLGEQRIRVVSHSYTVERRTGVRITWSVGRGVCWRDGVKYKGIAETYKGRLAQATQAKRAERSASKATRGKAVDPWSTATSQLKRTVENAGAEVAQSAITLESVLRTSATGATVTLAPGLTVTVHAATVDSDGRSFPIREFARRAALQGVTID